MEIIGITSKKRHGKDTIANYLIEKYGFQKYSFADPIKRGCMEMFGFTEEQLWGDLKEVTDERWGITPRKMLQVIGTEIMQYDIHKHMSEGEFPVGRNIWNLRFKIWVTELCKFNPNVKIVIPDLRFQHEADVIKSLGGNIWRVTRPTLQQIDGHASENESDGIISEEHIINDGSLEELYNKINLIYC